MSALRHHWLPRFVWLGTEAGISMRPLFAFTSERTAREWAAEAPDSIGAVTARRIWRVAIRPNVRVYRVTKVAATTAIEVDR